MPAGMTGDIANILVVTLGGSAIYMLLIWLLWRPVVTDAATMFRQALSAVSTRKDESA